MCVIISRLFTGSDYSEEPRFLGTISDTVDILQVKMVSHLYFQDPDQPQLPTPSLLYDTRARWRIPKKKRKKSHVQFSFIYAHKNGIGLVASNHITRLLPFQQLCRTGSRFTLPGRRCSALDRLQLPVIIRSFQMDATDLSVLAQF